MHPSVFWAMDAGIAFVGGMLILLFRKRLQAALDPDLAP
jgi:hypothetical protein